MAYSLALKPGVEKIIEKLSKKDPVQFQALQKKIKQILDDPFRFKPLHAPMQNLRRVHIMESFVLVFSIHEKERVVEIWDYDHHDHVYQKH